MRCVYEPCQKSITDLLKSLDKGDYMTIVFKMNRRIELFSLDNKKIGNSTIQDEDSGHIFISIPMGKDGYGYLQPGEKVKATYCGENNKIFSFVSEIVENIKDQIPLIKLKKVEEYETIQRRRNVRIPLMIDFEYFIIDESIDIGEISVFELEDIYEHKKWKKGYTYDLSAGGAGIVIKESLQIGNELFCVLKDDHFHEAITGKIIRITKNEHAGDRLFRAGICFINMDYQIEEKLVRYIFQKMREQLKVR